jgi:UDP-N-acetylglucosamine transferase subunit ALG13
MIFVTAGTTAFPFRRLEELVLELQNLYPRKEIILQNPCVVTKSFPKTVKVINFATPAVFESYIKKAEILIVHAGYATVMQSLQCASTKPIVMPRRRCYKEHVNDHQLYFARFMQKQKLVTVIEKEDQIQSVLKKSIYNPLIVNRYLEKVNQRRGKLIRDLEGRATL